MHNARAQFDMLGFSSEIGQRHNRIHAPGLGGPDVIDAHGVCSNGVVDQFIPVIAVVIGASNTNGNFHLDARCEKKRNIPNSEVASRVQNREGVQKMLNRTPNRERIRVCADCHIILITDQGKDC